MPARTSLHRAEAYESAEMSKVYACTHFTPSRRGIRISGNIKSVCLHALQHITQRHTNQWRFQKYMPARTLLHRAKAYESVEMSKVYACTHFTQSQAVPGSSIKVFPD